MNESFGIATRTSYVAAILFALLMLGVPSFFTNGGTFGLAGNAAADGLDVDRNYIIAVSELTVDTLNPNTYTMVSEGLVIFPVYSYLLQYDVDLNIIGDAAYEWSHSADGLLWNFKLWDNIYFIDPAYPDDLSHQLTGRDVRYTFWTLQNESSSRLHFYFPEILDAMWESEGDPFDLWIRLTKPFAPIMDSWVGMPILPAYYWEGEDFINFNNDPPIGSGPYYYRADNDPDIGTVMLARNNHWYMTENFGWQVHTDNIVLFEELNDDSALIDLEAGDIDVMLRVSPSLYLTKLPTMTDVERFSYTGGFVYEFNLCQMSDELRRELGGSYSAGETNQLLLLEPVRRAFAMSIDKEAFVSEVQYGLGSPACSLIPKGNKWHWEVSEEDKIPASTAGARQLLNDNGWIYDELGNPDPDATPLARKDPSTGAVVDVLSFRYYTLDTSVDWKIGAQKIANWTAQAGIELNLEIKSVSQMNTVWYAADYDVWLWDWVMGILGDGSGIMEVLTSMSIGESSDVYWVNETYDRIYNESLYCMDPVYRRQLVDQLQIMAYEHMSCQCVSYSADNYGVSTKTWDYDSMGDWNTTYYLLPDIWYQWLAMQLYPNDNNAPYFTMVEPDFETQINVEETFMATAADDGPNGLLYRWFFGDGSKTDWSTSGTATHTYTEDGSYDAWVAVREDGPSKNNYHDNFTTVYKVDVTVKDLSNDAPADLAIDYLPSTPDTGDVISFSGSATDDENDELYYSWDFGGGHWLDGPDVDFQFTQDGYYSVTMYVTDNHLGTGERPVSLSQTIEVRQNYAPTVDVPSFPNIPVRQSEDYTVTATDPDDPIRITWDWGDGEISVTTTPTTSHTYDTKGTFTLTVYADDLTGLDGHNASDSNYVYVYNPQKNKEPVITSFTVTDNTPYTGQIVTFTGTATDGDGDALKFTFDFGDGTYAVEQHDATDPNTIVSSSFSHAYTEADTYTARLYVYDNEANISSSGISMTVSVNYAPVVSSSDVYGSTGVSTAFAVSASDFDGDTLTYTWIWDDGSESVTAVASTTHTYAASGEYVYAVWVNDGHGHNVSDYAYAYIDAIPTVEDQIDFSWSEDLDHDFLAVGSDPDGDTLTYTWDFDDGTLMVGETVTHQWADPGTYSCVLYADDGFPLTSHNVSVGFTVTVVLNVPLPPEVQDLPELWETIDETVYFTASASDPNGDPMTYEWDFGDSSPTESGQSVSHVYTAVGDYTYSVTVTDDGGLFTTKSNVIHIESDAMPIADAGLDQIVSQDELVTFDGSGSWDDVDITSYAWTIAPSGDTMTGVNPTHTFADAGVYTVTLEVTDTVGQTDTDEMTVTVLDTTDPTAVAAATPSTVDMGDTVTLDGSGSSDNVDVVSWSWEFYDGAAIVNLDGESVDYVFANAGVFTVTLTVADAAGNEGTDTVLVTVNDIEAPVAAATADPDPVNFGDMVTLDGSGSTDNVDVVLWTWEIYMGATLEATLDGMTVTYTFDQLGDYDVALAVEDGAGNSDSTSIVVTSEDSEDPVAVATFSPASPMIGEEVTFDGSDSTDNHGIFAAAWAFDYDGDIVVLDGLVVSFTFDIADTYYVAFMAMDETGNYGEATVTVTVSEPPANLPPTASAVANDTAVEIGDGVTFDGSGSTDSDGTIANYTWTITLSSSTVATLYGASVSYTFGSAGVYTATLNVTDDDGAWDTASVDVTVTEPPAANEPPVAVAEANDTSVYVNGEVELDGSDSTDEDTASLNYTWTIEFDGDVIDTLYGDVVTYTFEEVGTYTITLTVTDSEGLTDEDSVEVEVTEAPPPADDDDKSFIEQYGLYIGILAVVVIGAALFFILKKKKGGAAATGVEGMSAGDETPPAQ